MVNKPRAQGTKEETDRKVFYADGTGFKTSRLVEGGMYDESDVEIVTPAGRLFLESKARANLNPHQTLKKAIFKAAILEPNPKPEIYGWGVAVSHKKLVDKGGKRRVADGELRVVSITPEYHRYLLKCEAALVQQQRITKDEIPF